MTTTTPVIIAPEGLSQTAERLIQHHGPEHAERTRRLDAGPDAWIRGAVGGPLSSRALLDAAREAIAGEA